MKNRNKMTKFPVARIKKIMQKDEEVGKVAQATPIVICTSAILSTGMQDAKADTTPAKALELFLQMIIDEASSVTVARGSKKVEAYHLKHAVETTEMLDFLKEIVEPVPDPSQGGKIALEVPMDDAGAPAKRSRKGKKPAKADDEEGGEEPVKKKRRRKAAPAKVAKDEGDDDETEERDPEREREEGWDDE
ncbi:hypothetical protein BV25DRAFT_1799128 [Artomyces pyxidatus]|uniref:Uncharacterized protein n=1 Tax=Artomyces pyxidatus TaxID=48021 RepID=A0ACB8T8K1_9AGAM|nr:hypothetical protein BV25DRAFT_1799128 [Artomyces pyxidatus]